MHHPLTYLCIMLCELISRDPEGFKRLCEEHQVASLHAFGSSVHGPFKHDSDVDLVVDLKAPATRSLSAN